MPEDLESRGLGALGVAELSLNRVGRSLDREDLRERGIPDPLAGFAWQRDDSRTRRWRPQGIAGFEQDGHRWLVISWYAREPNEGKGARVSFVDLADPETIRYRHVLLVEPTGDRRLFQSISGLHAGGLAVLGDRLYVADTARGIRVFDLRQIFPAVADSERSSCGFQGDRAVAYDYRYILPQVSLQNLREGSEQVPRFSFLSVDWQKSGPRLLSGNFHRGSGRFRNPPSTLVWWRMTHGRVEEQLEREVLQVENVQGAARFRDMLFLSCSYKGESQFVMRQVGGADGETVVKWPVGAEDLYLTRDLKSLWCLTEFAGQRVVFAVDPEALSQRK